MVETVAVTLVVDIQCVETEWKENFGKRVLHINYDERMSSSKKEWNHNVLLPGIPCFPLHIYLLYKPCTHHVEVFPFGLNMIPG